MTPHRSRRRVHGEGPVERDVDRELESHLALRADELEAAGWSPAEARAEARRLFGDRERVANECGEITRSHRRAVRRTKMMGAFVQDLKYAWRSLTGSPGFTVVAVATLALGIGANTAIFSVVDGVLLDPLPFEDPEELVWVRETGNRGGRMAAAWPNVEDWHREATSFDGVAGFTTWTGTVLGGDAPVHTRLARVSAPFWDVFGVRPIEGRLLTQSDQVEGAAPVALVSERYWRTELGRVPLAELELEVAGARAQVVGILPSAFDYPVGTDVWFPVSPQGTSRTAHNYSVVARLKDGVSLERGREELDALTRRIVLREPDADPDYLAVGAWVVSLRESMVGETRSSLLLLLGAAGLVLLIACSNLASTILARGTARARELAVRAALGADRARIVRQLFTETLLLALAGGAAGALTGWAVVRAVVASNATAVPRLEHVGLDATALAFTGGVSLLTAVLFGLLPALRLGRTDPGGALRAGERGNAGAGRGRVWSLLVGAEVALSLMLLLGSGLLIRSFQVLLAEDVGFDSSDVVNTPVSLSRLEYATPEQHQLWYTDFLRELEALPGVESAALLSSLPMSGFFPTGRVELDGDLERRANGGYVVVSGSAFEALDVPLLAGRTFDERDTPDNEHVAIVSQSFADTYWPGEDPVGRSVTGGGMDNYWEDRTFARVVGVVGDVRFQEFSEDPVPTLYFPYTQRPFRILFGANVIAEASRDPAGLVAPIRATLRRAESDVPPRLALLDDVLRDSVADRRFVINVLGGFSLVALLLAGVGIYGVVSYTVARRTREMGIRIALGADRAAVIRMVFTGALRVVVLGVLIGGAAAFALSGAVRSLLYRVGPSDPFTFVIAVALLLGIAALAVLIPAARGTRIDPMITMRAE